MSRGGWPECAPDRAGMRDLEVEQALELVQAYRGIARLCVLRHGQVVLDRQIGCTPRALFWLFSASKPVIAIQVHLLAERGAISLSADLCAGLADWCGFPRSGRRAAPRGEGSAAAAQGGLRARQYPAACSVAISPASGGTTRTGGDAAGPV